MATGLLDARSRAYALASAIHVSTIVAPNPVEVFEGVSHETSTAAASVADAYLQCLLRYVVVWEEMHRGRMAKAHEAAEELMAVGRRMNDPRAIGFGMQLEAWAALGSDDYVAALNFAEEGIGIARTPIDQANAINAKNNTLVMLRRPEALPTLRDWMHQYAANGWGYMLTPCDGFYGIALVLHGEIGRGIHWTEQAILKREDEGYGAIADWYRMFLCEIYLEIIAGQEKPPAKVLARNIVMLVRVIFTAQKRICALVERVRQPPN
jgi:hypothetical protein